MISTMTIVPITLATAPSWKRAELLVRHRHRSGQANARLIVGSKLEVGRSFADRIARRLTGLQRGKVEHRLDFDEMAKLARLGRLPGQQHAPRKACGLPGQHLIHGVR